MHLIQKTTNDLTHFIIVAAPEKYHEAIRGLAFGESVDGFIKSMPADTPYIDTAFARYQKYLETILKQATHEIPVPWERAFDTFLQRNQSIDADWWVTGSLALTLRGLPIQPGDIDLIVDGEGAIKWGHALADMMIEPVVSTDWFCKYWGRAFDGARIEWIGDIDPQSDSPYVREYYLPAVSALETIHWRGHEIRIPPIEPHLKMDEARGRLDRVNIVRQALKQNRD